MPEPRDARSELPPVMWPDTLPNPQAPGFTVSAGVRTERAEVLFGVTRLAIKARTAPATYSFTFWFTPAQMQEFEGFYRDAIENHNGEFYARWIGGSRIVAFAQAYQYSALGEGYVLSGTVVRTRIDHTLCDDFISAHFFNVYRADLDAADIYQADLAASDIYKDDFSLQDIADNEC